MDALWPAHTVGGLDSVKLGVSFTLIVNDPVHPDEDVKVMFAEPGATAVRTPVDAFTEMMLELLLDHAFPAAGG
jgi:hypothetical protein